MGLELSFFGELKGHHQSKQGTAYNRLMPTKGEGTFEEGYRIINCGWCVLNVLLPRLGEVRMGAQPHLRLSRRSGNPEPFISID